MEIQCDDISIESNNHKAENVDVSILVPFFNYAPLKLTQYFLDPTIEHDTSFEIVFFDDASSDRTNYDDWLTELSRASFPWKLITAKRNRGRAAARNILMIHSRSSNLIYLDCDMVPDERNYLQKYKQQIAQGMTFVYGGRSISKVEPTSKNLFHYRFTEKKEQLPADVRRERPALYFLSSNFLVKKKVLEDIPFDQEFQGWGWEDCEWAHRVNRIYPLLHIDNPATHLGLLPIKNIIEKYEESARNFQLVVRKCPELVRGTAIYRVAKILAILNAGGVVKELCRIVLQQAAVPMPVRIAASQVFKSAIYAQVLR